jgi:hypothetical protein
MGSVGLGSAVGTGDGLGDGFPPIDGKNPGVSSNPRMAITTAAVAMANLTLRLTPPNVNPRHGDRRCLVAGS